MWLELYETFSSRLKKLVFTSTDNSGEYAKCYKCMKHEKVVPYKVEIDESNM